MRGHRRALVALALVLPAVAVLAAPAGGKWVRLFNGTDLAGWKAHGAERWVVDKGEILGEAVTKEYGYLSTEKTYRDFELKVKFKAEGAGNSGVGGEGDDEQHEAEHCLVFEAGQSMRARQRSASAGHATMKVAKNVSSAASVRNA